jgi:hypothetical protein
MPTNRKANPMTEVKPHQITLDWDKSTDHLAYVYPASEQAVARVLNASPESSNGRSEWVFMRLADGTLILGVFPQGDTYTELEKETFEAEQALCKMLAEK